MERISFRNSNPVHTTAEEFENAALFLRLGLPSTLIRHENGAFGKLFSNGGIWKRRLWVLVWTETFWIRSFSKTMTSPVIAAFSNSSGGVWTENIWCVFRVKTLFTNFSGVVWTGPQVSVKITIFSFILDFIVLATLWTWNNRDGLGTLRDLPGTKFSHSRPQSLRFF